MCCADMPARDAASAAALPAIVAEDLELAALSAKLADMSAQRHQLLATFKQGVEVNLTLRSLMTELASQHADLSEQNRQLRDALDVLQDVLKTRIMASA